MSYSYSSPSSYSSTYTPPLETYFLPGYGISRPFLQSHICFYLGPRAFVRPYTHQGRDGFLVSAPGKPLTQIDDIREQSRAWEMQTAARMSSDGDGYAYLNQPVHISARERLR
ncbi:MAG: hypothetical protein M1829_002293 [Trizodia sp. TS-e1964]|nr:MAG: hypothetical protein M1829_002293 [Trizodia sp. TS-e1964]